LVIKTSGPPDFWESLSWRVTVISALFAAIVALVQGGFALVQRFREIRWKQAELARQLVDQWFSWEASNNALTMVDEGEGDYSLDRYGTHHVDPVNDIPKALELTTSTEGATTVSNTPKDRFIRKCFDVLLYNFERVEYSIDINVIRRDDVLAPTEYYVGQLAPYKKFLLPYITFTRFSRALKFLTYFKKWGP